MTYTPHIDNPRDGEDQEPDSQEDEIIIWAVTAIDGLLFLALNSGWPKDLREECMLMAKALDNHIKDWT